MPNAEYYYTWMDNPIVHACIVAPLDLPTHMKARMSYRASITMHVHCVFRRGEVLLSFIFPQVCICIIDEGFMDSVFSGGSVLPTCSVFHAPQELALRVSFFDMRKTD